jgi:insulysin
MGFKIWKYCLLLGILLQAFLTGEESYTIIPDTTSVPLLNPALSQRQTLKLRLSNGLEAYLISDPQATQSGAVLTVQAGSWDDPAEYPGIAHFLEHMLFLGTEKYPIESDYDHFIRGHDGRSNAYTTNDYTLYLFAIRPDALEEALDRFSFFFKKPLFNPSGVSRELHAIDQEYAKNFNQDSFRELHVGKELANAQHPFHNFSIGNSETLSKVTQQVLRQWYQEHYSAHLMRLIVYAPYPMETLKSWVIQDFKDIPSTWQTLSRPQVPLLAKEMRGKIAYIESVKDVRNLNLTWELPPSFAHPSSFRPEKLICSILGYEGSGSLLAHLKTEGLAEGLSCTSSRIGKNHLLFSLSIDLTQEGLQKIPQVIEESFQAIQMLQEQDLPSYLFEEFKKIHTFRYQYQPKEDAFQYLMQLGGLFVYEDLSTFPESVFIPQNDDPKIVREFLEYLTPQYAHFAVLARQPSMTFERTEQWVRVPYQVMAFSSEQLTAWSHLPPHPHLHLPPPNPFLPQDLKLVNAAQPQHTLFDPFPHPLLLVDDPQAKIYFAADDRFQIPQTLWFFEIRTPSIKNNDPLKVVLTDLYIKCLEEELQPYSYPAKVADLSYQISRSTNGLSLSLYGYRDKAENLFDAILERFKNCHPSEAAFRNFKDSLLRQYRDFAQESPLEQGLEAYQTILYQAHSTHQQQADALQQLSYETFLSFIDHLFDHTYVEGLLYGKCPSKASSASLAKTANCIVQPSLSS